jgi:hypothetical protein
MKQRQTVSRQYLERMTDQHLFLLTVPETDTFARMDKTVLFSSLDSGISCVYGHCSHIQLTSNTVFEFSQPICDFALLRTI